MKNILLLNSISPKVNEYLTPDKYAVSAEAKEPIAVLVRSADMNSMEIPPSVLAIARAGAGVNNIPIDECAQKGIVVFNTPGANANAVKELILAAMLIASRNIIEAVDWEKDLKGKGADVPKLVEKGKSQFVGPEIKGKRLGVIGLGAIGGPVANSAVSLGMDVIGFDPFMSVEAAWGIKSAIHRAKNIDEIYTSCDYITIHVPFSNDTRDYISNAAIAKMKDGVIILNFARGELVNSADILANVRSGKIARYVTDFPTDEMLCTHNIIAIPHLGASTPESEDNCAIMASMQLADYIENGNIVNSVNYPNCELPRTEHTRITIAHQNLPNIISQITTLIGTTEINIANMINKSLKSYAYTIIDTDQNVSGDQAAAIKAIEGVLAVRIIV